MKMKKESDGIENETSFFTNDSPKNVWVVVVCRKAGQAFEISKKNEDEKKNEREKFFTSTANDHQLVLAQELRLRHCDI